MRKLWIGLLCFLLVGCSSSIELKKQTFTIELGKDIYANPSLYVKDGVDTKNLKVVCHSKGVDKEDNRFITNGMDYLVVGEYDFAVCKGDNYYDFVIKVKDTQAPICNPDSGSFQVSLNQSVNWDDYLHATDLSGVSYEATLDTSVAGDYTVDVKVSDRFGNSVTRSVSVVVS